MKDPVESHEKLPTASAFILPPGEVNLIGALKKSQLDSLCPSGPAKIIHMKNEIGNARAMPESHPSHPSTSIIGRLSLSHALRVKSAELWLRLGEADEALRELEALPEKLWNHPSAVTTRLTALEALRQRTGTMVYE
jgi:hypothetical protein